MGAMGGGTALLLINKEPALGGVCNASFPFVFSPILCCQR
jgi:hypothetical protein